MEEAEKIQGESRFNIFEQLQRDKTLIKMHLLGKDYERLTIITSIRTQNNIPFFLIDYPEGFKEAIADIEVWKIHFEFTGKDKLEYSFKTSGEGISRDEIWLKFPEIIERIQRRKDFRLEAPPGTKLFLKVGSTNREMSVVNTSLGGALVSLRKGIQKDPILKSGQTLRHIQLEFPSKEEGLRVYIKEAVVKRLEKDPATNQHRYIIQFIDIEKNEEKALIELIYRFQRQFLQKRLRIDH